MSTSNKRSSGAAKKAASRKKAGPVKKRASANNATPKKETASARRALPVKKSLPAKGAAAGRVDPVTLEVVRNALVALVVEMTDNLIRTAYSAIAAEIKDFSISLLDAEGNTIAQAPDGVPMFCADLNLAIRKGLVLFKEEGFAPGDIILSNDTETNGQHINNMVAYSPIFAGGKLLAFAAVRSHWVDLGGMAVGSMPVNSRDIFSEGIQLPFLKVYRGGKADEGILRLIRANSRFPDLIMGDMRAQISACRLGERRFLELVSRYGAPTLMACVRRIWDEAEAVARRAVEAIPDGVYEASCVLDNDGFTLDKPIPLAVKVIVKGSGMTLDFSGMSKQVAGPYNSRASETIARVSFKYLTTPDLAISEGAFRNLTVIAPEGTVINAHPNAPMAWFNMGVVSTIDLVLRALAPVMPDRITAGNADNIGFGHMAGVDPRNGRLFHTFVPYIGGLGARPDADGTSAVVSLVQGDVRFMPVEVQETVDPVRVRELSLRADSGGAGRYRGGLGVVMEREVLANCDYNGRYERTKDAPWGFKGGEAGKVTTSEVRRAAGAKEPLPLKCERFQFKQHDAEIVYTAGGGGYGPAWERAETAVLEDARNGYISVEAARRDYGVVIEVESWQVNAAETGRLRAAMREHGGRA